MDQCSVCKETAETINLPMLYVFGSEGVKVCHSCQLEISQMIMNLTLQKQRERKSKYLENKIMESDPNMAGSSDQQTYKYPKYKDDTV